jgi:hypothetical protein
MSVSLNNASGWGVLRPRPVSLDIHATQSRDPRSLWRPSSSPLKCPFGSVAAGTPYSSLIQPGTHSVILVAASTGEENRVFVARSEGGAFTGKSRQRLRLDCGELGYARINLGQTLGEFGTELR